LERRDGELSVIPVDAVDGVFVSVSLGPPSVVFSLDVESTLLENVRIIG
jgi:hypothetical protein